MPGSRLEKLYYKIPIPFQDVIFSLYGWNLSRKRYSHWFHDHLAKLMEMEWWPQESIEEYQNRCFAGLVKHAYNTVPFYRKWYKECGVNVDRIRGLSDLSDLPVLTKQLAKKNQRDMVSTIYKSGALDRRITSGTTGTPLTILSTKEGLAFQWAIWWRHKARFGLTPKHRHLTFGARVPIDQNQSRPPFWRNDFLNNRVYLSTYHISERTVGDIVAFLNRSRFAFYTGYPSAMYVLASLMDKMGLHLKSSPDYIVTGADALLPRYESLISRVFGAPVTEQYGMAEFAGNMSKCERGVFHEDFECCYVEDVASEGPNYRRLLLTGWGNLAMPFIRYEVGDFGLASNSLCACGRRSKVFSSIDGRLEDYVITPDGRRLIGMNQVFEYAESAKEIQIHQAAVNQIEFRVVPGDGFGDKDKAALLREFQRRAGTEMEVTFAIVNAIQRSPSGKLKAVISDIAEESIC